MSYYDLRNNGDQITSGDLKVTRLRFFNVFSWTPNDLSVTDLVLCLPLALDLVAYWSAMGRKQRSNLLWMS